MRVLTGNKVVELGRFLVGPFAGAILAHLGAEIRQIEKPDGDADARRTALPSATVMRRTSMCSTAASAGWRST